MGIVNAVLITSKIAPRWVYNVSSINTYGVLEATLSVGGLDDPDLIDRIGEEFLALRSAPQISHTYQVADVAGQVAGVDYQEGDTLNDPNLRVIDLAFTMLPDGRVEGTPVLATKLEEQARRSEDRIERLIAEGGGNTPSSSAPADTGSGIEAGKLDARQLTSWSWTDSEDLDPLFQEELGEDEKGWQPFPVDTPLRLTELCVECDWVDENGVQVTDGDTRFRLLINDVALLSIGALGSVPTDVVVGPTQGSKTTPIYGGTILNKGDTVRVAVVTSGSHRNGSVTINCSEAV